MNRIAAIMVVVGVLFVGLSAVSLQLNDHNEEANETIVEGLNAITNVSFVVVGIVGIFVGGIILLFAAIAAMGGR